MEVLLELFWVGYALAGVSRLQDIAMEKYWRHRRRGIPLGTGERWKPCAQGLRHCAHGRMLCFRLSSGWGKELVVFGRIDKLESLTEYGIVEIIDLEICGLIINVSSYESLYNH